MNPIFISYRRDDGIDTAQLLQRDLQNMFGDDAVFLDTRTLKAGDEFPTELENAVKNAKVVIAMIGKNWKGTDPQVSRLMQETDWVRKEQEIALGDDKKKIFLVFVKGAKLTDSFKDLPPSLERLTKFNGIELREKEFKHDLVQIVSVIEHFVPLNDPLKDLLIDEGKYRYPPGRPPFKGLDYFTEEDARLFFGRGYEIRNNDLVFLFGQSGSGKSSLLFAGLKPRLEFKKWKVPIVRREAGVNLAKKLDEYLSASASTSNLLVILDQVEESNPRIFNKELLEEVKSKNLVSLLNDQIVAMKERFQEEVENGLVLDVLYFFTTPRGTSAARTTEELVDRYDHKEICKIVTELKNKYLLSEPKKETINIPRLARDALAPLIRELYIQSDKTGQRASRILEIKKQDIETGAPVEFSKTDLAIIDAGKTGMRKLTEAETIVIENSRKRIKQHELKLEEKNKQLELALKEANEQTLQARAKALAATARQMLQTDLTMALRLAEAACKTTLQPTKEAQLAFVDITKSDNAYYKSLILGSGDYYIYDVAFSPDGKFILAGSQDETALMWSLDGKLKQIFAGHEGYVTSPVFSPDRKCIVTGSADGTARTWRTFQGMIKPENTYVPTREQMKEYDIPEDME